MRQESFFEAVASTMLFLVFMGLVFMLGVVLT